MSKIEDGGPAFPVPLNQGEPWRSMGPCDGMTLRQYAAIKLRVPNSGTDWLDEMIRTSLRDDLAAKTVQAYFTDPNAGFDRESIEAGVGAARRIAATMFDSRGQKNEQQGSV